MSSVCQFYINNVLALRQLTIASKKFFELIKNSYPPKTQNIIIVRTVMQLLGQWSHNKSYVTRQCGHTYIHINDSAGYIHSKVKLMQSNMGITAGTAAKVLKQTFVGEAYWESVQKI